VSVPAWFTLGLSLWTAAAVAAPPGERVGAGSAAAGVDGAPAPAPAATGTGGATPEEGAAPSPPSLLVYPAEISLSSARDRQRVLVMTSGQGGVSGDRSDAAAFEIADPRVARLEGGEVVPVGPGRTSLWVYALGQVQEVPITVVDPDQAPPMSFELDVVPVLTARGCNSGACHGSARGQDGFHLSLFGYDPEGDRERLVDQLPGRRINRAVPSRSLLLEKATGAVPHTGGALMAAADLDHETLITWIREGATADAKDLAELTAIELFPPEVIVEGADQRVGLMVRARYSDGTDRDVTPLARFRTSNEVTARPAEDGEVLSGQPGEAFVTASYGVFTVGLPVIVLAEGAGAMYEDPAAPGLPGNWIDRLLESKHRRLRVSPSTTCSDEEFIRRVTLDTIGLLPTVEERAGFLADERPSAKKRAALVEGLLARREFSDLWVMKWAELLGIRSGNDGVSEKSALLYFEWVRDRLAANVPVDEVVRQLLTASGGTFSAPESNFYQVERDTLVLTENVAQAFLGIRLQCAQCHNHPFDRWTQDDYYGFAAFFAQVGRKRAEDPREYVIYDRRGGEVRHPVTKRTVRPRFLGGEAPELGGRDRREVLAEWLTSPENPWFSRSLSNRIWAHFMGRGVVEPVDDFRVSNPPSEAALLDGLSERLVETGYDLKQLVREITSSRAYQRSTAATDANAQDVRNFTRQQVRRLRAETLLDVVCQVTGSPVKLRGLPLGARAVEIADGATSNYFLQTFGRAQRESVCACEVSYEPSLSQALHLLNGSTVSRQISAGALIKERLAGGASPTEVISWLYLRCLGREPTPDELATLTAKVTAAADQEPALEDVFWALLNSREFLFQH